MTIMERGKYKRGFMMKVATAEVRPKRWGVVLTKVQKGCDDAGCVLL